MSTYKSETNVNIHQSQCHNLFVL